MEFWGGFDEPGTTTVRVKETEYEEKEIKKKH
jgi:hypothetical protein